ncbi:hypothetical protein CL622_05425 [archaeon]|nr:hypothetical protein [archaeon]
MGIFSDLFKEADSRTAFKGRIYLNQVCDPTGETSFEGEFVIDGGYFLLKGGSQLIIPATSIAYFMIDD